VSIIGECYPPAANELAFKTVFEFRDLDPVLSLIISVFSILFLDYFLKFSIFYSQFSISLDPYFVIINPCEPHSRCNARAQLELNFFPCLLAHFALEV